VDEREFWWELRARIITGEELPPHLGWLDWFEPKQYLLGPDPRIVGRVGFVDGRFATSMAFSLRLPPPVEELADIDWLGLIPAPDETGWIVIEGREPCLTIRLDEVGL
jgi:hypothetical protein